MNHIRSAVGRSVFLAAAAILAAGCATFVPLDRSSIPRTAIRTVNISFAGPDEPSAPHNEFGFVLLVAKTIAEAAEPMLVDTAAIERNAELLNEMLFETLEWDLEFPLLRPVDSRSQTEVVGSKGEWANTTRYRYDSPEESTLSVDVELSYVRAPMGSIGTEEAALGVSAVYPHATISVELTSREGETLWQDRVSHTGTNAIPYGSVQFFGVSVYSEYKQTESFEPFFREALSELVEHTLHGR